nr:amine oxidase [flavin-containing] A-like [Lytechinus pictus]
MASSDSSPRLSAAKLLHESGQDVLVLEANDRVGGRTLNIYDEAINYTDLGGAYIGPTQDRIYRLAKEMGVDTVRCYDTGMAISYHRGRWRKMSGLHPDTWNPLENLELNHFWHLIDRMGEKVTSPHLHLPPSLKKTQQYVNETELTSGMEQWFIRIFCQTN